jgi:hypothetical protein
MKLISVAIALLASAAVVASLPVYGETSTTSGYPPASTHNPQENYLADEPPSSTTSSYSPSSTSNPSCDGFKITSQTEAEISWIENSQQEVVFEFTGSSIKEVEYVDLVEYETGTKVDEWATGPWNPSNPRTGLHEVHIHRGYNGYYQFLVYAATEDHQHCKYYSGKFKITPKADNDEHHHGDNFLRQVSDTSTSTSTTYDEPTSTTVEPYESTSAPAPEEPNESTPEDDDNANNGI